VAIGKISIDTTHRAVPRWQLWILPHQHDFVTLFSQHFYTVMILVVLVGCATGTHVPVAQPTIKPAYRSNSLEGKPFSRHFPFLQFVSKQTNVLVTNKTFLSSTHSVRHRSGRVSHVPVATRTRMQRSTSCQIRCHNQDRLFLNVWLAVEATIGKDATYFELGLYMYLFFIIKRTMRSTKGRKCFRRPCMHAHMGGQVENIKHRRRRGWPALA